MPWYAVVTFGVMVLSAAVPVARILREPARSPMPIIQMPMAPDPWVVEYVTKEQIYSERRDSTVVVREKFYGWGGGEKYTEYVDDYVVVRLRNRGLLVERYQRLPVLRIGAVSVSDPEFDTKLAEMRGVAEERASTLNLSCTG